jgi:tRNA pseudouridine55 synthase
MTPDRLPLTPGEGQRLDGWLVIDKPLGVTSARVVSVVRRALGRKKAGHAGTLDPLATGVLPVALGEATKTVGYAMTGRKRYRFCVRWGVATASDDTEGAVTGESPVRPNPEEITAALPRFTGAIWQTPPAYSAIKIGGRRAYRLARADAAPALAPRQVEIAELRLVAIPDPDHAEFEAEVGKGTYIRSLARDLAAALGTLGHVAALRRLTVGRFTLAQAISLDFLGNERHIPEACEHLLPIETALDDIPALALTESEATRLRRGQRVTPFDPAERVRLEQLGDGVVVGARSGQGLVALARIQAGSLRPLRVINP